MLPYSHRQCLGINLWVNNEAKLFETGDLSSVDVLHLLSPRVHATDIYCCDDGRQSRCLAAANVYLATDVATCLHSCVATQSSMQRGMHTIIL